MSRLQALRATVRDPAFRTGVTDMMATCVGIAAWGLVTGVAMVKTGMSAPMAIFMSLVVYAGSAQLAVLPLMAVGAPLWVVWLTAMCVNLRFVIFSSMWRNFFGHLPRARRCTLGYFSGDLTFVLFVRRYADMRPRAGQEPYFWGASALNWTTWQVCCIAGVLLADLVPVAWGLGFAGTLALVGVLCSMLQDRVSVLAAAVAGAAALAAYALPLKLNILVGIAVAVVVGLVLEAVLHPAHPEAAEADAEESRL